MKPADAQQLRAICSGPLGPLSRLGVANLNAQCDCLPLSRAAIDDYVVARWGTAPIGRLTDAIANVFAGTAVFVSESDWQAMQAQIRAIDQIVTLPGYRQAIASRQPGKPDCRTPGLFMGYDFHLSDAGPRLIEINTNAGGAMLANAALAGAGRLVNPCGTARTDDPKQVEAKIVAMLLDEWRGGEQTKPAKTQKPRAVAIVDTDPERQYLYPDMLMVAALLSEHDIRALVVDPSALTISGTELLANGEPVDLVYNRLTDFQWRDPAHAVLKAAHDQRLAVVSPAPEHHAFYADKRNLALLANAPLAQWGASPAKVAALAGLPQTRQVDDESAPALWDQRKSLFFKPQDGYGSRAVYRGSKLTRRVWQEVQAGGYLAQQLVEPDRRVLPTEAANQSRSSRGLKFDIRIYSYRGEALLTAARLYSGQTTNFRTIGGGFAPVVRLP